MQNLSRFFNFHEGEPWQRAVKVSGAFLGILALAFVSVSLATITSAQETPRPRVMTPAQIIQRYPTATSLLAYRASDADYDGISENDACPSTPWELIAFRTRTKFVSPIIGTTTGIMLSRIVRRARVIDVIVGDARTSIPLNETKSIAGYQVTFTNFISPVHLLLIRPVVDAQGCVSSSSEPAISTPAASSPIYATPVDAAP